MVVLQSRWRGSLQLGWLTKDRLLTSPKHAFAIFGRIWETSRALATAAAPAAEAGDCPLVTSLFRLVS